MFKFQFQIDLSAIVIRFIFTAACDMLSFLSYFSLVPNCTHLSLHLNDARRKFYLELHIINKTQTKTGWCVSCFKPKILTLVLSVKSAKKKGNSLSYEAVHRIDVSAVFVLQMFFKIICPLSYCSELHQVWMNFPFCLTFYQRLQVTVGVICNCNV